VSHDRTSLLLRHLLRLSGADRSAALSDRELLVRFARQHDETAFETLVARHGPMVWRLCRRLLREPSDAEDVFQATFLLLTRRAGRPGWHSSLGGWLHEVAYRLCLELRRAASRRERRERKASCAVAVDPLDEMTVREAQAILDEEMARLPEKLRAPLILCCLEGLARDEAARQLGWRASVLKSRLEQARERLRRRLNRRGVVFSIGLAATILAPETLAGTLRDATTEAAISYTANRATAATVIAARVLALAEGAWKAMWITRLSIAAMVCVANLIIGGSGGFMAYQVLEAHEPTAAVEQPAEVDADPPAAPQKQEDKEQQRRLAAAEAMEQEIRRIDARLEDRELKWLDELLAARRKLILAEERLHHLERTQATQATPEQLELEGFRKEMASRIEAASQLRDVLKDLIQTQRKEFEVRLEKAARLEEDAKQRYARQVRLIEEQRMEALVRARLEVVTAQEELNLLLSRQATERTRGHAHRDALENQVRILRGAAPLLGQRLGSTSSLEAKLDRLFREVEELRLEVKRLANARPPGK
jgi:RNA polymerase sigma factor (sigma-70 family)